MNYHVHLIDGVVLARELVCQVSSCVSVFLVCSLVLSSCCCWSELCLLVDYSCLVASHLACLVFWIFSILDFGFIFCKILMKGTTIYSYIVFFFFVFFKFECWEVN